MTAAAPEGARLRFPGVRPPQPLLPPEQERRLTERQRQVLDALEQMLVRGALGDLTMAEIAGQLGCSLRTLYGIAPSKDELVLTVVDRRLHRIGRAASEALDAAKPPLANLRVYLQEVNEAVRPTTVEFVEVFAGVPGASRLFDAHERYVTGITQSLLDRAVAETHIAPVDTAAVAHVLGSLGRELSRPDILPAIGGSPKDTADAVSEIILRGLESG